MFKKFFIFLLPIMIFGSLANFTLAQNNPSKEVNFFYSTTCPYCAQEKIFLEELEKKYSEIEVNKFVISNQENVDLLKEFYQNYKVPPESQGLVPITFIEGRYFAGFNEKIGRDIESYILEFIEDSLQLNGSGKSAKKISLPFLGEIDISKFSLLALAVVLGALDGFNICSLGALILILGLVLVLKSRIKMLIFGGTYILTTAIIYGILILFWYKLFSLLSPYLRIMETLIGLLGIGGGIYLLRQFFKFRKQGPTCEIDGGKGIVSKVSLKMRELLKKPGNFLLIIGSIFLFAFVITVIEFPCSAVVPLAFAGILAQSQLPTLQYLIYIAIFILFYMLDEFIIFLIAVFTSTIWLASSRFVTWATLVGAVVLLLLGVYYLFGIQFLVNLIS